MWGPIDDEISAFFESESNFGLWLMQSTRIAAELITYEVVLSITSRLYKGSVLMVFSSPLPSTSLFIIMNVTMRYSAIFDLENFGRECKKNYTPLYRAQLCRTSHSQDGHYGFESRSKGSSWEIFPLILTTVELSTTENSKIFTRSGLSW